MIIYLHGFDSNSPGNPEKVLQLQFIDPDVRLISYSTRHPKHDMQHLLKEVDKMLQLNWLPVRHPSGGIQSQPCPEREHGRQD